MHTVARGAWFSEVCSGREARGDEQWVSRSSAKWEHLCLIAVISVERPDKEKPENVEKERETGRRLESVVRAGSWKNPRNWATVRVVREGRRREHDFCFMIFIGLNNRSSLHKLTLSSSFLATLIWRWPDHQTAWCWKLFLARCRRSLRSGSKATARRRWTWPFNLPRTRWWRAMGLRNPAFGPPPFSPSKPVPLPRMSEFPS